MSDSMMTAVRIHEHGGTDVLRVEEQPRPTPDTGQVLIAVHAAGVNFIDIRQRTGDFKVPSFPVTLGWEGAGEVAALGADVADFEIGDRVAWLWHLGSYATHVVVPATDLVRVPESVGLDLAAAVMLQGLTAQTLASWSYPLKPGETCLVHAAAGGVGGLLTQLAKARGARVIGTVSRQSKIAAAQGVGADEVVVYTDQDLAKEVRALTADRGVDVVYDGIGQATFFDGLDALRAGGCLVLYGQASGPVPPIDTHLLQANGGRYLTRATFGHLVNDRASLVEHADLVFGQVGAGALKVRIAGTFPLERAAAAHTALSSRTVSGKLLLTPR